MLKIPPYGKALYALQKSKVIKHHIVIVWIGLNAWKKAEKFFLKHPSGTLALPAWESPDKYFWPVKNCDVLIEDTGYAEDDYVDDLIYELYKCGAVIVQYAAPHSGLTIIQRSVSYAN
jgi:hypothetical protein